MALRLLHKYLDTFRHLSREVWLLSAIMLINRSGSMVIPFLGVYLTKEFGYSLSTAGTVMMFYGAGSLLGTFLGGRLTDKIGFYQVMFWSLFLSGFVFWILLFIKTFALFCAIIFLASFVADAFRPAGMVAVSAFSKPGNITRSFALLRLAINIGWAVGPALGGLLIVWAGYQSLFLVDGATCLAAAVFLWYALPKKVAEAAEEKEDSEKTSNHINPLKDRQYLFFLLMLLFGAVAFMQLFHAVPVYLEKEIFLSEDQIGLLLAINPIVIALTEMPLVAYLEKRFNPIINVVFGSFLFTIAYFCMSIDPTLFIVFVYIFFITAGEIWAMPFSNTFAVELAPKKSKGRYLALYNMTYSVSHIIAPAIGFNLAEWFGFSWMWFVMGFIGAFSAFGFWVLSRRIAAATKQTKFSTN